MKNVTGMLVNWHEAKGKLKQRFAILTDNDMMLVDGKHEELLARLQAKLGKTKEQMLKLITEL